MKKLIFIDTNLYLRFYDSKGAEFVSLLEKLINTKDSLFTTEQIYNEIQRNKVKVFSNSFDQYLKQSSVNSITLPDHLDNKKDIKTWNKQREDLTKKINESNQTLKNLFNAKLKEICDNTDNVSDTLNRIFKNHFKPETDQYNRALMRKNLGNPPGKKEDPIGDELIWEQLLSIISNYNELVIVTNDTDYTFQNKEECILNPFLKHELIQKNPKINVVCFNSLSKAFNYFSKDISSNKKAPTVNSDYTELIEKLEEVEKGITLLSERDNKINLSNSDQHEFLRLRYLFRHKLINDQEFLSRLKVLNIDFDDAMDFFYGG